MNPTEVNDRGITPLSALVREPVLPTHPAIIDLLPERGLRRGSVIAVGGAGGASSLLFALLARPLAEGSWAAVVGLPELGFEAAAGIGAHLERLALIPRPGKAWLEVTAALIDAFDLVVVRPPSRCPPTLARRLATRGRERGCVLIVASPASLAERNTGLGRWPEPVEVAFEVEPYAWQGLERGYGTLTVREITIEISGRRVPTTRTKNILLPDASGGIALLAHPLPIADLDYEVAGTAG